MERMGGVTSGNLLFTAGEQMAAEGVHQKLGAKAAYSISVEFLYRNGDSDYGVWKLWLWVQCTGFYLWRILG